MGKGKGRRRRQTNYLAAHGNSADLPAPPTASDDAALPAKLRRIITLKSPSAQGPCSVGVGKKASKLGHRSTNGKHLQRKKLEKEEGAFNGRKQEQFGEKRDASPCEASKPKEGKKRKWEVELQILSEKFKAKPLCTGLNERKKRYLKGKKTKKKRIMASNTSENSPSWHKQESITFGDVVEAPPRLSFPKKQMSAADERLRQQAITTYREKKKWFSRPGSHQPPPLASVTSLSS